MLFIEIRRQTVRQIILQFGETILNSQLWNGKRMNLKLNCNHLHPLTKQFDYLIIQMAGVSVLRHNIHTNTQYLYKNVFKSSVYITFRTKSVVNRWCKEALQQNQHIMMHNINVLQNIPSAFWGAIAFIDSRVLSKLISDKSSHWMKSLSQSGSVFSETKVTAKRNEYEI